MLQTKTIDYCDGATRLQGYLAYDDAKPGPLPGVLIAHPWAGRNEFVMDKARCIAELGYAGFALDMYGDARVGEGAEECSALMMPFMEDRALLQRRMACALEALRRQPEVDAARVAAMGFCFGGLCVLDLARSGADLRGAVSFHGLLKPPGNTDGNAIQAKVLVLHGHDDPMAPVEDVTALKEELTAAGADWQVHVYGNTVHAFTNPLANDPGFGTVYNAAADRRSWRSLVNFLAEVLD
ncbi:dienelactone hydrolase family protein [Methylogaea oryzae]|uniref:Carboxymethylenebutenolidase n=2 Tax=Methylogaea oryzae TaxID=1295382 RepID=A0A8D4VLE6_9GAMM|nr:dienelactone hydrolase family protein [Methylogaea oryzae]BBL69950.1 carboxymethylenebutenolidase [Methylogaea oryzae]